MTDTEGELADETLEPLWWEWAKANGVHRTHPNMKRAWLAGYRAALKDAWDEGFNRGSDYGHRHALRGGAMPDPNPYRCSAEDA